jgi:predicted site-specific integrase-resolvase
LLSTKEVSERVGFAIGALENWRYRGKGPGWRKFGKIVKYPESEVDKRVENYLTTKTVYYLVLDLKGSSSEQAL